MTLTELPAEQVLHFEVNGRRIPAGTVTVVKLYGEWARLKNPYRTQCGMASYVVHVSRLGK